MTIIEAALPAILLMTAAAVPAPQHFHRMRTITCPSSAAQAFVAVDEDIWTSSRSDLGDVRIYDGAGRELPYALRKAPGAWMAINTHAAVEQWPRKTVIRLSTTPKVPIDRLVVDVPDDHPSFRRQVTVRNSRNRVLASTVIERWREGAERSVNRKSLGIMIPGEREGTQTLTIDNEDDEPLPIRSVRVFSAERRIFFRPAAGLRLVYGDPNVVPPIYDYAKFFTEEREVSRVKMGPPSPNPAYRPRDDTRPWSERHPSVLWTALVLAIAGIAVLSLKQMRT
ncbi:MAG: hypothetical protein ABI718_05565 [Acidobacteriota bacterium]